MRTFGVLRLGLDLPSPVTVGSWVAGATVIAAHAAKLVRLSEGIARVLETTAATSTPQGLLVLDQEEAFALSLSLHLI